MSKLETTKRYHLIINKLRTAKRVNFAEIAGYLRLQSGIDGLNYNISLRTFQRDIQGIGSIFGIYIKFDFSGKFILSKNLNRKRTTGFLKPSICLTHLKLKKTVAICRFRQPSFGRDGVYLRTAAHYPKTFSRFVFISKILQ